MSTLSRDAELIEKSLSMEKPVDYRIDSKSQIHNLIVSTDQAKIDVQTRRLLKKYIERKHQEIERKQKVKD